MRLEMSWLKVYFVRSLAIMPVWSLVGCGAEHDAEDSSSIEQKRSSLVSYGSISEFKASNDPALVVCDEGLLEQYRILLSEYYGLDESQYDKDFSQRLATDPIALELTPDQILAWRELHGMTRGRLVLSWGSRKATPALLDLGLLLKGPDGKAAAIDLETRVGGLLRRVFRMTESDALVLRHEQEYEHAGGLETGETTRVRELKFLRTHRGLPVFGDRYAVTLRTDDWCETGWSAHLSADWAPNLDGIPIIPVLTESDAVTVALDSGEVPNGQLDQPVRFGFYGPASALAYEVYLSNDRGERWEYFVAAHSGSILAKSDRVMHDDGTLRAHVGRPHEGSSKYLRPLPHASIYDHYLSEDTQAGCAYPKTGLNQRSGDGVLKLGETNYSGSYSGIWGADSSWFVDYRGPYVRDVSRVSDLTRGFASGVAYNFSQDSTHDRSRRGEAFYILNYGAYSFRNLGVPQFEPLPFEYITVPNPGLDCNNPPSAGECCPVGSANGNCVYIECYQEFGTQAAPSEERTFRKKLLHELGHTLRQFVGSAGCQVENECEAWEEGRSDFTGVSLVKFEIARPEYLPSRSYPADYSGTRYERGSIWTALYGRYLLQAGVSEGLKQVNTDLASPDKYTVMVGPCARASASKLEEWARRGRGEGSRGPIRRSCSWRGCLA